MIYPKHQFPLVVEAIRSLEVNFSLLPFVLPEEVYCPKGKGHFWVKIRQPIGKETHWLLLWMGDATRTSSGIF
ncbi:hypothetical protein Nepgr_026931 [Nepenthes gracilis]|uniref:Uncharacterized protein n=1 Tax=Nepenthes gracilis TaxID=150966 RepID=A0AAD3T9I1_NEPGR|nr:hypothetical protein Nepgr_026931 [Nepenthes gracilis]